MQGKRIAILESRFGDHLAELLRSQGADVLQAPALAELPDVDTRYIGKLVGDLLQSPPKLFLFQTGVGTRVLFETTDELGETDNFLALLAQNKVAVRGPKPAAILRGRGVRIDYRAADPYTTEELLRAIADVDVSGAGVVVQRYGETNADLDRALAQRGADLVEIPTYRWALPEDTGPLEKLVESLRSGSVDAVVFTSASQMRNLLTIAEASGAADTLPQYLNQTLVASIGPVCSRALQQAGVNVTLEATPPKLGPMVKALTQYFA